MHAKIPHMPQLRKPHEERPQGEAVAVRRVREAVWREAKLRTAQLAARRKAFVCLRLVQQIIRHAPTALHPPVVAPWQAVPVSPVQLCRPIEFQPARPQDKRARRAQACM